MLSVLSDPTAARPLLEETLGLRIADLAVLQVTPRADWSVQYQATVHGERVRLTAQHYSGAALEKAYARVAGRSALAAAREDLELLVFPFPLDPKLKLCTAMDGVAVASRLGYRHGGAPELLRYVPARRCVLRYTFSERGASPLALIGKLFRDGRGEALGRITNGVAGAFNACGDPRLTAPRALAYLPDLRLLLQEALPGRTLYSVLHDGMAAESHMIGAARAIALLHAAAMPLEARWGIEEELALVSEPRPSGSGALRKLAANLTVPRLVPIHRDFYDKQLIIDGPRTGLIDLDTLALGPAEIDLANFVAHIHLRALQGVLPHGDALCWERVFLSEYGAFDSRLFEFFLATACLRLASLYATRPNGHSIPARMLDLSREAARRAGARPAIPSDPTPARGAL